MSASITQRIKNYLRLSKLTPQERDDFETIRQAIKHNPEKVSKLQSSALPDYYQTCTQYAYVLESDIKLLINYYMETSCTPSYIYPGSIPVKNHQLYAYVAWNDGTFTDLSGTKRAYLLLKTIRRQAAKCGLTKYCNPGDYTKEFIARHGARAR